jgi:hypothetical protein
MTKRARNVHILMLWQRCEPFTIFGDQFLRWLTKYIRGTPAFSGTAHQ